MRIKSQKQLLNLIVITGLMIFLSVIGNSSEARATGDCDYYASPNGTGNGLLVSSPFKIANFWSKAGPGKTLCLLDGIYKGSESMIDPPDNLSGREGSPISVRALNSGKVRINGENARNPIFLNTNNYFLIEGVNAHNSKGDVVHIRDSEHNIIRKVVAWNAADSNNMVFGTVRSSHNLLEDVAGFGVGERLFNPINLTSQQYGEPGGDGRSLTTPALKILSL